MKTASSILLTLVVGVLTLSAPLWAHHGTAVYDSKHPLTLSGTVTEYRFANPHVLLFFDAKDAGGKVQKWAAEIGAPNNLNRSVGWTGKTIKAGDAVTITGSPSRNGKATMISTPEKILINGKKILPAVMGERAGSAGQEQ
jgi:hypothetical protein